MRRLAALALIAGLSLGSSGCGVVNNLLNRGEDVVDDTLSTDEIATDAPAEEPSAEEFKDPLLPGLPSAAEIASAELIRPTNAEERIKGIEGSRSDPYALVPVPPAPTPPPAPPTSSPGVPSGSNSGGTSGGGTSGGGTTGTTPGNTIPLNELPSLPQPTTAVGVVVTGIVQINGDRYAIINAPGEPTSRYVKAGDYIAGGRILVKRIETRPGSEPVVILEENGIEVAMPVGGTTSPTEEPPAAALPNSSTTAALPQLTLGLSPL